MDDRSSLRIRRVTNGYIVDIVDDPMTMYSSHQAVFRNAKEIAEALPTLLNDPPAEKPAE